MRKERGGRKWCKVVMVGDDGTQPANVEVSVLTGRSSKR